MFKRWQKKKTSESFVGLVLGEQEIGVVVYRAQTNQVSLCHSLSVGAEESAKLLQEFVQEHQLQGSPCAIVLLPNQYQMVLTEALDVGDDELSAAMRFKAKDLISTPIDEVEIEAFRLPDDAYRGRMKMCYVAAAKKTLLAQLTEVVATSGLELQFIDIADMAIRNLVLKQDPMGKSVALANLRDRSGLVDIVHEGNVYMSRTLDVGLGDLNAEGAVDGLILEFQRSLDYYESQQSKGSVAALLISAKYAVTDEIITQLDRGLAARVMRLDIAYNLELADEVSREDLERESLALGGALRGALHAAD